MGLMWFRSLLFIDSRLLGYATTPFEDDEDDEYENDSGVRPPTPPEDCVLYA
jgi:hypothetical protein